MPPIVEQAAEAAARAQEMLRRQTRQPPVPEPQDTLQTAMTTSTIHLPVELLGALRAAANRRADRKMREDPRGRGGRPSVSEIVVELLTKHRDELDGMD